MKVPDGWWKTFPLSYQQEDPADAASLVRDYVERATEEITRQGIITHSEWIESVERALHYRSFFGVLSWDQLCVEFKHLSDTEPVGTFMVYLSDSSAGKYCFVYVIESQEHGKYATQNHFERFPDCLALMMKHGLDKQHDRGKGLIFAATARKLATAAIECWLVVAKRFRVVRDIRVLIAKQVWADRHVWIN